MTADMRLKWPTKRILIGKTDQDVVYRRVKAHSQIISTCIAIVGKLSLLCLQLQFGTMPSTSEYTTISEYSINLGKYLLVDAS